MACVKSAAKKNKIKYACCTETIAKGISTSSHFLHKVTVSMTTVWWLVLPLYSLSLSFFSLHSLHICNISVWRPFMTVAALPSPSPPTVLYFSSLTPPFLKPCSLKDEMKKKKSGCKQTSGETMFWWSKNDATSKCLRVGFFPLTKMRPSRGRFNIKGLYPRLYVGHTESGVSCCFVISFPLLVCKWTADTD